jgi:hypothetical protein
MVALLADARARIRSEEAIQARSRGAGKALRRDAAR